MDILSYLSELIQTRKAVGVSGLGTVYKKKLPGRYDAETHSFVPPSYTIDFTPEVKEELILAEFISKKRNVSNDTANYFIDEFSNGILQQLNDHQEADFGDLGNLYKAEDELRFEPSEKKKKLRFRFLWLTCCESRAGTFGRRDYARNPICRRTCT
ncbi:HU domain-containing protein [Pedobacter sp. NJ-S-72]